MVSFSFRKVFWAESSAIFWMCWEVSVSLALNLSDNSLLSAARAFARSSFSREVMVVSLYWDERVSKAFLGMLLDLLRR